jgi:3-oxoacyl-[acyl-carrier-protein] synthase II
MTRNDVVITGIGLVSALGEGPDAHWQALSAGTKPVVDETSYAPWTVHPLPALSLDTQIPKKGDQRQMEPWQRLGTYAAGLAIDDADARGLVEDMDLIVAAGGGERDLALDEQVTAELANSNDGGGARLNEMLATGLRPTLFLAQLSNLLAGNISIVHGVTGSSRTFMGEESAAADAVRIAHARLSEGRGSIALVGGAMTAQRWDLLLLYRAGDGMHEGPHEALSRRQGMILGGMAGFLVLETAEHAKARGARVLARLDAVASDATRRALPGESAAAARALLSRVAPGGADAVISGASGAPEAWREEESFLSELGLPVRRPANLIGHGVEGAFPAHVALAALALSHGGFYAPMDPADVGEAVAPSRILVTGFGQWRGEALAALSHAEKI